MDHPGEVNDGRQEAARDSVGSGPERVGRAGTGRAETGSAETGSAETGSAETGTNAADAGTGTADAGESTTKTRRPGRLRRHPVLAVVVAAVITAVLILGAANIWVRAASSSHSYRTADAPFAPVALVLGAGLRVDGSPSQYLQDRLDDAITLYRAGKVRALLVSGDNGSLNHDEPTAMMTYIVAQGIPASQVIRDYAGFDTYDSCVRAKKIFGVTRALVVTQEFHLPRSSPVPAGRDRRRRRRRSSPRWGAARIRPARDTRLGEGRLGRHLAAGSEIPGTGRAGAQGRCRRLSARWGVLCEHGW